MIKPIIATWGIGPSYRKRVKNNIIEAINSGYNNIMDYAILTDLPEDFLELSEKTGRIKLISNIHDIRENYKWSVEHEHIPTPLDDKGYGVEYVENLKKCKLFSYALHRFGLIDLSKKGYTKIVFMDADMKIRYDKIGVDFTEEEFWKEFETEENSMKGCYGEVLQLNNDLKFTWSRSMGSTASIVALQMSSILVEYLRKIYNKKINPLITKLPVTEGPFRYYNFNSPEKVMEYFNIWNKSQQITLTDPYFLNTQNIGGYMLCDYITVAATNLICEMKVMHFTNVIYDMELYYEDRYFLPRNIAAITSLPIESAETQEEFFNKNKGVIDKSKELGDGLWPVVDPKYFNEM